MRLAPIALFVYNRPWHTRQATEALKKNPLASESELHIYSDGARGEKDNASVAEVRKYLAAVSGFRKVVINQRRSNFGLAESIISGVSEMVNKYGRVIVLEDDLVTAPGFLKFMNEALNFYANEDKVISIHGYFYPVKAKLPDTFFLRDPGCWGWATWKRGWDIFEADGQKLLAGLKDKNLQREFDYNGGYPFYQTLKLQANEFIDSWAIRWYGSAFLNNKLTLYPGRSLVKNIGFDDSGVHGGKIDWFGGKLGGKLSEQSPKVGGIIIEESADARRALEHYFKSFKLRLLTVYMRLNAFRKLILKRIRKIAN